MKIKYFYITVSLLIGLFIYTFYRTEKTVVNELLIRIISFESYAALKERITHFLPLNGIIVYSLPEGLWVYCITLTSKNYYFQLKGLRVKCVYIPLIYCVGLEVLQLLHIMNGRFDFMDILVSFLFWLIGNYTFNDKSGYQDILATLNSKTVLCIASYSIVYLSHVIK